MTRYYGDEPYCVFCEYTGPSPILEDYGSVFVIEPLGPVTPGHVLVIPKQHFADWFSGTDIMDDVIRYAAKWVRTAGIKNCNLITSRGPAATQTIGHLHVHLIPRRSGDGLKLPWSTGEGKDV